MQSLLHGEEQRDGRCKGSLRRALPDALYVGLHICVIAAALRQESLFCLWRYGDDRQTRRHGQRLLGAGDGNVDIPFIGEKLVAAYRGYAIYNEHCVVFLGELSYLLCRIGKADGGLIVNHGHGLGTLLQCSRNLVQVIGCSPFELHGNCLTVSLADLGESLTKLAVGNGYDLILVADGAGNSSIHA